MSVIKSLLNKEEFFKESCNKTEHRIINDRLKELLDEADEYIPRKDKGYFSDRIRTEVSDLNLQISEDAFEKGFSMAVQLIGESMKNK